MTYVELLIAYVILIMTILVIYLAPAGGCR
jgi:hypothetical protein